MATQLRNTDPSLSDIVSAFNDLKAETGAGASFHLDKSEVTVTAANATDLATSLTLVKQMMAVYAFHIADTLAHKAADTTNTVAATIVSVVDLASAITAANELKAAFNAHIASTTFHYNADATNTVAAANATDQTSLDTLANAIKTALNAHMASGPAAKSLRLVGA